VGSVALMQADIVSQFASESTVAWVALAFCGLFVLYILLKKYGMI